MTRWAVGHKGAKQGAPLGAPHGKVRVTGLGGALPNHTPAARAPSRNTLGLRPAPWSTKTPGTNSSRGSAVRTPRPQVESPGVCVGSKRKLEDGLSKAES